MGSPFRPTTAVGSRPIVIAYRRDGTIDWIRSMDCVRGPFLLPNPDDAPSLAADDDRNITVVADLQEQEVDGCSTVDYFSMITASYAPNGDERWARSSSARASRA